MVLLKNHVKNNKYSDVLWFKAIFLFEESTLKIQDERIQEARTKMQDEGFKMKSEMIWRRHTNGHLGHTNGLRRP
jgi:hypothetical protein